MVLTELVKPIWKLTGCLPIISLEVCRLYKSEGHACGATFGWYRWSWRVWTLNFRVPTVLTRVFAFGSFGRAQDKELRTSVDVTASVTLAYIWPTVYRSFAQLPKRDRVPNPPGIRSKLAIRLNDCSFEEICWILPGNSVDFWMARVTTAMIRHTMPISRCVQKQLERATAAA